MVSQNRSWQQTAGTITGAVVLFVLWRMGASRDVFMMLFAGCVVVFAAAMVSLILDKLGVDKGISLGVWMVLSLIGILFVAGKLGTMDAIYRTDATTPAGKIAGQVVGAIGTLSGWVIGALLAPGALVLAMLGIDYHGPGLLLVPILAWVFWFYLFPRFLKFVGLWDPFRKGRVTARRPRLAQMFVRIGEWSERKKFGTGPTGAWAGLMEVLSNGYREGDVFLGRPKGLLRPIGLQTERHMITISQTGAGKSVAGLIPNLCLHKGSALIVDPKGELATLTAKRRGSGDPSQGVKGLGQDVHILDPFHIVQGIVTAGYNPLDEMGKVAEEDEDRAVSYAGKLAEALVTKLSEVDKYWDAASETFLRGLILLVYLTEPPAKRNLVRVRDLLVEGDAEAFAAMMESAPTKKGTAFELLLERMYACAKRGEVGAAIAKAARSMEKMGEKQMGSVLTNAMEHTAFLDTPEMRKVCRGSSFLLSDLKSKTVSVYLCLPLTAVTGKEGRWLRMFVLLFIDMMQRSAFAPITPVLLAIDEFPSLGHLEGIETVAPYMRSFGVRFWAVAQDFEQLKKVYPASWQGFLGGAEAIQCMGIAHWQTVELMAQMLSSHVVMEQQEGYGPGSVRNVGVVHPLLDPAQVSRILAKGLNNQIVLRAGRKPMLLKICPYFDYMPWWYYNPSLDPRHIPEAWRRRFWRRRS